MKLSPPQSGLILSLFLCGIATSQTTISTTTTLVVVPTLVQTSEAESALSLTANDFLLTDNSVPQKVTLEDQSNRPLSLVVLIQTGGDARGQFPSYAHLDTMLTELLGRAPNMASIVNFDSRPEAASPFSPDLAQWSDAIDHPDQGDTGAAIFDALAFALDLLRRQPANTRRAVLLISQGHDSGSKTALKDIIRSVGETNTAVYSLTFSAEKTAFRQAFKDPAHGNPPIDVIPGGAVAYFNLGEPLRLAIGALRTNLSAEIATLSGGETSSFENRGELEQALSHVANHIRNSYILSFNPTSAELGLHTLRVRLPQHPELLVSARTTYWSRKVTPAP